MFLGLGCNSVVEHILRRHDALGSSCSAKNSVINLPFILQISSGRAAQLTSKTPSFLEDPRLTNCFN
jgi:hypothetical protein